MKRIIAAAGLALAVLIAAHGNSIQAGDPVGAGVMLIPLIISVLPAAVVFTGGGRG